MAAKPTILVLCTGNSCRSQMAEGYLQHLAADRFGVHSAGTEPKEQVHPLAVQVMREDGVDIGKQYPKSVKEFLGQMPVRYLVIVCGGANEACPRVWPGLQERLYWPFDDPAGFQGSEPATLAEFRRVRDQIKAKITDWLTTGGGK